MSKQVTLSEDQNSLQVNRRDIQNSRPWND